MKTAILPIWSFLFGIAVTNAQNQPTQEIYIVGTMHTIPKIVKRSYKPMLKNAIRYHPDAIYVESPRAQDTISWEYLKDGWSKGYKAFYYLSDSIRKVFNPDFKKLNIIISKNFKNMTESDLDYAIETFAYTRDHANHEFYSYIKKNGIKGTKNPTRNEDGDLTFKLALDQNITLLKSMDDQQTNKEYHEAWRKCAKEGRSNGSNAINKKMNKKIYNSAILPALFRGLGKHVNKRKSLERLHQLSSFTYVKKKTPGCTEGETYWHKRNFRMAKNIATQVITSGLEKNIVIVGASHVIGLEKELNANYPNLKIVLMDE